MALPPSLANTSPGRYNSAALEKEVLVFDRPALLQAAIVGNFGASLLYIWIEDRSDTGVAGAWPCTPPIPVPAGSVQSLDVTWIPRSMGKGIYLCASTSPTARTLSGSNDAYFECIYAIL